MSTPERQQDPGEHGYGSAKQDAPTEGETREHPLDDPDADPRQEPSSEEEEPSSR